MQQARHAAILPGQHAVLCDTPGLPPRGRTQGQDGRGIFLRGALLPGADARVRRFLFPPGGPKLGRCAACPVFAVHTVHGKGYLGIDEEMRDVVAPLVADHLGNGLRIGRLAVIAGHVGPLALHHGQRQAVHIADDVRHDLVQARRIGHGQFFGNVEDVVFRTVPVQHGDGAVRAFTAYLLRNRDAVAQQIIDMFVGGQQAVTQGRPQGGDDLFHIGR